MIALYRPDDPIEIAADYVVEEGAAAFNHLSHSITSAVRFLLWLVILCLLYTAKRLQVLDDKWVEHRQPAKEASCQS